MSEASSLEHQSTLSDAFLRHLMAVGQVDVLVGLPTLDNAATVIDVVRAVHLCFTRDFARLRTVMINSDGGSTDGTPELIRAWCADWGREVELLARRVPSVQAPVEMLENVEERTRALNAIADRVYDRWIQGLVMDDGS